MTDEQMVVAVVMGVFVIALHLFLAISPKLLREKKVAEAMAEKQPQYEALLQQNIQEIERRVYEEHVAAQRQAFEFRPGGIDDKSD